MNLLASIGGFTLFCRDFWRASRTRPLPVARCVEEAWRIGVLSLPVLLTISVFVGTNLALQGYHAFTPLGGQRLVGMFVALSHGERCELTSGVVNDGHGVAALVRSNSNSLRNSRRAR